MYVDAYGQPMGSLAMPQTPVADPMQYSVAPLPDVNTQVPKL